MSRRVRVVFGDSCRSRRLLLMLPLLGERMHFSSSRTSRPVGCRSEARSGARSSCAFGPVVSRPAARRYTEGAEPRLARVRPNASAAGYSIFGLAPISGPVDCWCWCSRTDSVHACQRRYSFGYFQGPS